MTRINVTINNFRTRIFNSNYFGYSGSGAFPRTYVHFYVFDGNDGKTYLLNSTHKLEVGDTIKASVKGENEYRGVKQIVLTRASLV